MPEKEVVYFILFGTLIILVLIGAVVSSLFLAHRRQTQQELRFTQAQLAYESELRTIESEVREATLTHLAAELHDNIGQLLAVMHFQLENQKMRRPELEATLNPTLQTLNTTIQQVRLLSHSLSHDFIGDAGLQHVIAQELQRLGGLGRQEVSFDSDGTEPSLGRDARTVAFRIFQEALHNAMRHANAHHIRVALRGADGFLLQVSDDGDGFDRDAAVEASKGLGLKNMQRRAALAGLQCQIDTAPGKGCIFTITAPPAEA